MSKSCSEWEAAGSQQRSHGAGSPPLSRKSPAFSPALLQHGCCLSQEPVNHKEQPPATSDASHGYPGPWEMLRPWGHPAPGCFLTAGLECRYIRQHWRFGGATPSNPTSLPSVPEGVASLLTPHPHDLCWEEPWTSVDELVLAQNKQLLPSASCGRVLPLGNPVSLHPWCLLAWKVGLLCF